MKPLIVVVLIVALFPIWLAAMIARLVTAFAVAGWEVADDFMEWIRHD